MSILISYFERVVDCKLALSFSTGNMIYCLFLELLLAAS